MKGRRSRCDSRIFVAMLWVVGALLCFSMPPAGARAADDSNTAGIPVKVVKILTLDDGGRPLSFPSKLFFDPAMAETYVLSGSKLVVYGPDFYPETSLGPGRGAYAPLGVFVDRDGLLYVCQGAAEGKAARLSIFSSAFFFVRDVLFTGFEGAATFSPQRVAVSQDGFIYLAGLSTRGVVVLDRTGAFSHWLKPEDRVYAGAAIAEALETQGKKVVDDPDDAVPPVGLHADIPAELLPKTKEEKEHKELYGIAPVRIADIDIDSEGHIYLLSEETGKVYVFSPSEQFLFAFGEKGGTPGKLSAPRGLAVDERKKSVYVVDYMRHSVLIYDLAGKFMDEIGGFGDGPGWFNFPTDVSLDKNDNLMVADLFNRRVQVLDVGFKPRFPMFGPAAQQQLPDLGEAASSPFAPTSGAGALALPESPKVEPGPAPVPESGQSDVVEEPLPDTAPEPLTQPQ